MADNPVTGTSDQRRFAAFISYSHADANAAAKLQRKLERYRLPRRIVETRQGSSKALGAIFRDREDLAAASSLSAAIRDAIAQSDVLVVLCSPDAAISPWVTAEIKLFRALHPDKPILAAVLSGEPAHSFPPALTAGGLEPLAADLRPQGDGPQLGFLKIVAGIANVPLDALIQRDAQRRIRRVTVITLGALAAMLIMAVMTSMAISARNEAARQRAEAEGLVEYMLTDLREKLRGVGRLDVMSAVNQRAMAHYSAQGDLQALSANSLERRARILHAMGEDDEKLGELDQSSRKFIEAHRTTAALLQREPGDAERIFAHAQSEYWVGLIAWRKGDRKTATRHWQAYRNQASALYKAEPDTVRSLMELGYSEGNLCDLMLADGFDVASARRHCTASVAFEEAALEKAPRDLKILESLANRYGWLADVALAEKNYKSAIAARKQEARLMERVIATDRKNLEYAIRRSWADLGLVEILSSQKQYASAQSLLDQTAARLDLVGRNEPDNPDYWEQKLRLAYFGAKVATDAQSGNMASRQQQAKRQGMYVKGKFSSSIARFEGLLTAIDQLEKEGK